MISLKTLRRRIVNENNFNKHMLMSARQSVKICKNRAAAVLGYSEHDFRDIKDTEEREEKAKKFAEEYLEQLCRLPYKKLNHILSFKQKVYLPRYMVKALELEIAGKVLSGQE